ncbi:hypothetical protein C5L30_000482 [Companilactobacillus farciminis]|uniref:Enterocin immunity protein n=1 Tax=Companilactobacillus farciminis TaxID=1612 RepID=A0A4R5NGA4_9LACO|nr:hypothetical protein [Companilactobacillus farciminis]ATO47331.1 hypothetical protein LF20184_11460 [Companilactobacillus farciminis KCTC 3681 = DSM 20184]KRK62759.1 hypothetical protein FC68_GL001673 [Companilactobacillus farciminis KCTC 3681 = DSM 20184]TDG73543.1 hypothetical protein C5L30_000482 [Companilactobacillus farciminis]
MREELSNMVEIAYRQVTNPKYNETRIELSHLHKELNDGEDSNKIMFELRKSLLQADPSLNLKNRISGLPLEYRNLFHFIDSKLKKIDAKILDKYYQYGFIPLKFGSTIKYP